MSSRAQSSPKRDIKHVWVDYKKHKELMPAEVAGLKRTDNSGEKNKIGDFQLSQAKAAALQEVQNAMNDVRQAQQGGNFADYGAALQRLNDAMTKFNNTK